MKKFVIALSLGLLAAACKKEESPEAVGLDYLSRARVQLEAKEYAAAREEIKAMREQVPMALNARETGILLMDSINLAEAQEQLRVVDSALRALGDTTGITHDTLQIRFDEANQKIKFYHRKLQHDRKNKKQH